MYLNKYIIFGIQILYLWGVGKLTYPLSANVNVLSATPRPNYDVSMLPAGGEGGKSGGWEKRKVVESTLVLAESVYVNLPWPYALTSNTRCVHSIS
jgi:hypothetical protein